MVELHDEVVDWMDSLEADEWDRTVIMIDRLAEPGTRRTWTVFTHAAVREPR
ncbi:MAG: hypothetical protein ACT4OV_13425 [Microthrixaceae bacterium]